MNILFVTILMRNSVTSDFVFLPVTPPTIAPTPPNRTPPAMALPTPPFVIEVPFCNNSYVTNSSEPKITPGKDCGTFQRECV